MTLGFAVQLMKSAVLETLLVSAPILSIAVVTGLVVSILQATTSLQEQTLTFVPKIAAIFGGLLLFGTWMFTSLIQYTIQLFQQIPNMIR